MNTNDKTSNTLNTIVNLLNFILVFLGLFFIFGNNALASTFALPKVEVYLKSLTSGQVTASRTDMNGNFNTSVGEDSGEYNLFIGDQNMPPIKLIAKKGVVSARIVVLTEGSTTVDPVVKKTVKKSTPVKAPVVNKK